MENLRVTLKQIAERANVSIGTVDRALNNRPGVSAQSKQRVLNVAAELGYRPNRFASALSRRNALRLGVVFPDRPEAFYRDIECGVDQAARELQDYGVHVEKIRYELQSPEDTADCLHGLLGAKLDGLAINAAGAMQASDVDALVQAGVPVITFNTDLPDCRRLFYIGNHSRESGRMAGELLHMLLGGEGAVTVLGNFARTLPFLERFGGFFEFIRSAPTRLEVVRCMECRSDPDEACRSLLDLLERTPDIRGVFCTGYSSTIGAVRALRHLDRRDVRLIGYDLTAETADALREGWCDMLLYQEPFEQGYQAARLLARHLMENWLPEQTQLFLDTQVLIRSNMNRYLNRKNNLFDSI